MYECVYTVFSIRVVYTDSVSVLIGVINGDLWSKRRAPPQVDGESARDWYGRVRTAAVACRFGGRQHGDAAVADKFVTGLRPGPVSDKLLGERADGRPPGRLLAAAVDAEKAQRQAGVAAACASDALAEIREALKLYRYGDEKRATGLRAGADVCEVITARRHIRTLRYSVPKKRARRLIFNEENVYVFKSVFTVRVLLTGCF